ncbi:MAG: hypothetical protein CL878_09590 [Dehalococcoidia bacterium]|nr:hypothetical protein [Dehalococcoidia bacterium]
MWWAIGALTTGPYGDFIPVTFWGRAVASASMVAGLALLALAVTILGRVLAKTR